MEKLTTFLEEERKRFDFNWYKDDVKRKLYEGKLDRSYFIEKIEDHDVRLINFLLNTVMEEIEKEMTERKYLHIDDISTIINTLKVK